MDVAVLGTTETGRALAGWCVQADVAVRLYGEDANAVMDSVDAVQRRADAETRGAIDGTTGLDAAVSGAGVVVDATEGETEERRTLLAEVEELVDEEALIAICDTHDTITAVAAGLKWPGRAIGLHVVAPDDDGVVEVVIADQTTTDTRERTLSFAEAIDVVPLVVRDTPGFATTRLDLATIAEAIRMVEAGVASVDDIDRALELGRDHPIGPLGLADELGLDTVLDGLETLAVGLGGRFDPPDLLFEKVADGDLGRQSGRGFYRWENGERIGPTDPNPAVEARDGAGER